MNRPVPIAALCVLLAAAVLGRAVFADFDSTPEQAIARGKALLEAGQARQAIETLKPVLATHTQNGTLARLMAGAYLAEGNVPWALRTLDRHAAATGDCETRSWIVWIHLDRGNLDAARAVLEDGAGPAADSCLDAPGPIGARWALLFAWMRHLEKRPRQALRHLDRARRSPQIFQEDARLLSFVQAVADANRIAPIRTRLDFGWGWTSNALLTSPAEADEKEPVVASRMFFSTQEIRFVPPVSRVVRPSLAFRGRGDLHLDPEASDADLYALEGRIGAVLGYGLPRLRVHYAVSDLLLAEGDVYDSGPRWFSEAHRAQAEFEALSWLTLLAGGGRRIFREGARTRTELDAAVAPAVPLHKGFRLAAIGSGRHHDADISAYDAVGGTVLVALYATYFKDGYARLGASAAQDDYPDSMDYFAVDKKRSDRRFTVFPSLWSPSLGGIQAGLAYTYDRRDATIESLDYEAHEVRLTLAWKASFDPWRPRKLVDENRVLLPYRLVWPTRYKEELDELLRQEDAARRASSCVE